MLQAIKTLAKDETVVIAIMKNNINAMVELPVMTVKTIIKMLSADNGIAINALVEDLCPNPEHRDLMAMNCMLVLRGMKPDFPEDLKADRYTYGNRKMKFESYSLTQNIVTAVGDDGRHESYDFRQWISMQTEPKE